MPTTISATARRLALALLLIAFASSAPQASGQSTAVPEAAFVPLADRYAKEIRPLVVRYCQDCHAGDTTEADVDLRRLRHVGASAQASADLAEGRRDARHSPDASQGCRAAARAGRADSARNLGPRLLDARSASPGRRSRPGRLAPLEQRRVHLHAPRSDGHRHADPAREFPVDGAAGEGFTNTGNALVMSPALVTKYLDAGKDIADHLVLLPDGVRFSPSTSRRDWTNETLDRIRAFYSRFTDPRGGEQVNLQGIVFSTNEGGRLPVEKYLAATLTDREALAAGNVAAVAQKHGLNAKYLGTLWQSLTSKQPSLVLDGLRARWRAAKPGEAAGLTAEVAAWQKGLFKFATVGHIGKVGGPKSWLEPVDPVTAKQQLRFKLPAPDADGSVTLTLVASDIGDGNQHDYVVWQQPRLVAQGRPDILLRDVRQLTLELANRRQQLFAAAAKCLAAANEAAARTRPGRCRTAGPQARRRRPGPAGLAGLPGHRRRRRRDAERPFQGHAQIGRRIRVRHGLGDRRHSARAGQFERPACPHSRQYEASRRGGASLAHTQGGGRLAKPGDRQCANRRRRRPRPSRVRQRSDLVARTPPRPHAPATGDRHGAGGHAGQDRSDRIDRRSDRRRHFVAHWPARRQPLLRSDGRRPEADDSRRPAAPGAWPTTSRPTSRRPIPTPTGRATRASGISTPSPRRIRRRPARSCRPGRWSIAGSQPATPPSGSSWPAKCKNC